jgi:hypothetical protein
VTPFDQGEGLLQIRKPLQPFPGSVLVAELADLLHCLAEEEEVVCPIQGANGECPIHGELHVAGAGSFQAGGGDLLGKIGDRTIS